MKVRVVEISFHSPHPRPLPKGARGLLFPRRCLEAALGWEFGLSNGECVELTRVALAAHKTPVSRLIRITIGLLRKQSSGVQLIVSYADSNQNHIGAIYQAGN